MATVETGKVFYKYQVQNPVLNSKNLRGKIHEDPSAFWEIFGQEGSILENINRTWKLIYPFNQHVPEGHGVHIMASPETGRFESVSSLSKTDLADGARFMQAFLDVHPNGITGFNSDNDITRQTSASWKNLHIHAEEIWGIPPLDIMKTPQKPKEVEWQLINMVLNNKFAQKADSYMQYATVDSLPSERVFPLGGVTFTLRKDLSAEELADFIKLVDEQFAQMHRQFMEVYVINYDVSKESRGKIPYILRPREDIINRVDEYVYQSGLGKDEERVRRAMLVAASLFKDYDRGVLNDKNEYVGGTDNMHKVITGPAYSFSMFTREEGNTTKASLAPRFFRTAGVSEQMGYMPIRINGKPGEEVAFSQRWEVAQRCAKDVKNAMEASQMPQRVVFAAQKIAA